MRDVRVLELAGGPAAAYCGRLFATVGSDVVLAEPQNGGHIRGSAPYLPSGASALHEYLNSGKRSAVIALDSPELDVALRWADLVISTCDGDVEAITERHRHLHEVNPSCVHLVFSGFGLTGPYAEWRNSTLTDWAAGGYLYITGEPDREPLQGGGPWASYLTGVTGAVGAQTAVLESARTGQGQLVDVGAMEATASGHQWSITMFTHTGAIKGRWGARFGEAYHPMSLYRCKDGNWICVGAPSQEQWENFCITADMVELMAEDELYTPGARFERASEIDERFQPWLDAHTADEAVDALQANRVPASRVLTFAEVVESDHLAAREYWQHRPDVADSARMPASPFRLDDVAAPTTAPSLGADTESFRRECSSADPRPSHPEIDLSRIRILEFSVAWAGPLAGRFLADLGADVIKVEHPLSRGLGTSGASAAERGASADWRWGQLAPATIRAEVFPDADPGQRPWNRMGIWNKMNRNKQSLSLEAKTDDGRRVLDRLFEGTDLVLHNFTPRGARSLGIDPETLAQTSNQVASVAMTGYGETGPMATHSSYGPILEAYSGLDEATGYLDHGPIRIGVAFPDAVGGLHGAFASLTSIWERARTRQAVHVDLSQLETLLAFAGEHLLVASTTGVAPERPGNRSDDHAPQGVYRCAGDDEWVAVTVRSDRWEQLVDLLGDPDLDRLRDADVDRRRAHHDEIDETITRWTATRRASDAAATLQELGIAACPAFTNGDLAQDAHLAERGFIVTWDQPDVGRRQFPGFPIHFERTPTELGPAPTLGQHNDRILRDIGFDEDEIAKMYDAEVITDQPPA